MQITACIWQLSSLAEISEEMNNHLLPSNCTVNNGHILGKNQNDCFPYQSSYKITVNSVSLKKNKYLSSLIILSVF